jgi:hypothetical protein
MRIASLLKHHNIGYNTLIEVFKAMNITLEFSINAKLSESDVKFIEKIITHSEFEKYCSLRQELKISKNNLGRLYLNDVENIIGYSHLSKYEAPRIFEHLKSEFYVQSKYRMTYNVSAEKYKAITLSEEYFDTFLELYKIGKKLTSREYKNFNSEYEKFIGLNDQVTSSYPEKGETEEIEYRNNGVDWEEITMRALKRGDAESFGF